MRYIELSGTPRELGRQHGEAYREDIHKYHDFYCVHRGKTPESFDPLIRTYTENAFPDLVEEMRGIAEGADLSYEQVLVYNHFTVITGCTPVFFRHSDHGPLVAQTLDCQPDEQEAVVVRKVRPSGGIPFLCACYVGTVWPANFVSEVGLAMAAVSAHHQPYRTTDGTAISLAEAHIARTARSLAETFTIAKSYRYLRKVGIRLWADRDGNAMLVEGTGDQQYKTNINDDFAYSTGIYTSGHVEPQDEPAYILPKYARALTIERLFHQGRIEFSLAGMRRLMSHHAPDPGSICRHNRTAGFCTQSARIMIPAEGKLLISDGRPCEHEFEEFLL